MFFKPEKCDLFVTFDFSISYTPNCTVSTSHNFETISGEGLTEPPPQTPPPLLLWLRPRFGLRPQFSGASRPRLGLRPWIRTPKKPTWNRHWLSPPSNSIFVWLHPWPPAKFQLGPKMEKYVLKLPKAGYNKWKISKCKWKMRKAFSSFYPGPRNTNFPIFLELPTVSC